MLCCICVRASRVGGVHTVPIYGGDDGGRRTHACVQDHRAGTARCRFRTGKALSIMWELQSNALPCSIRRSSYSRFPNCALALLVRVGLFMSCCVVSHSCSHGAGMPRWAGGCRWETPGAMCVRGNPHGLAVSGARRWPCPSQPFLFVPLRVVLVPGTNSTFTAGEGTLGKGQN